MKTNSLRFTLNKNVVGLSITKTTDKYVHSTCEGWLIQPFFIALIANLYYE